MALRTAVQASGLARALTRPQGLQGVRAFHVTTAGKAGMGQPLPPQEPIKKELEETDELTWDDGSGHYVEGCLDEWVIMDKYKALAALSTGLAGFYGLYQLAVYNDKASTCPFPVKGSPGYEFPYGNLSEELGGMPTRPRVV